MRSAAVLLCLTLALGGCAAKPAALHDWTPLGDLVANQAFVAEAVSAWDKGISVGGHAMTTTTLPRGKRHRGAVMVLFAGHVAFGRLAVLTGKDVDGSRRLVVVTDDGHGEKSQPFATNDVAAPDFTRVRAVAIERSQVVLSGGRVVGTDYLVVLARAGTRAVRLTSDGVAMPVRHRLVTTQFQHSRRPEETNFTGDELPEGLVFATTPAGAKTPVLVSASCDICE